MKLTTYQGGNIYCPACMACLHINGKHDPPEEHYTLTCKTAGCKLEGIVFAYPTITLVELEEDPE